MAELKNTTLFREQCSIDGKWTGADSEAFRTGQASCRIQRRNRICGIFY